MFNETSKQALLQKIKDKIDNHHPLKPDATYNTHSNDRPIGIGWEYENRVNRDYSDAMTASMVKMISEIAFIMSKRLAKEYAHLIASSILDELYTNEEFERDLGLK